MGGSERLASRSDGAVAREIAGGVASDAETELVRRFHRRVFLYGMRHLGDEARASDLAQDVMTRVLERLRAGEVREPDKIGSFVLGTARMMARDGNRRHQRDEALAARVAEEARRCSQPVEVGDLDQLAAALAQLTERERTVVALSFGSGQDAPEIARVVGTTAGNVRVIRHRAVGRLRELLGVTEVGS